MNSKSTLISNDRSPISGSEGADWQIEYRNANISLSELLEQLGLLPSDIPFELDLQSEFPLKAPPHFLSLIRPGDPLDPLFLQIVSQAAERMVSDAASEDPLEETDRFTDQGLIKKYEYRALIVATGVCALHCRYCFRRHYDYSEKAANGQALEDALDAIEKNPALSEVILSGGDPLSLSDAKLKALISRLEEMNEIKTVRFHTRTLTAVPSRVTTDFLNLIAETSKKIVIVTHTNHANEWDPITKHAIGRLRKAGATLINQSVLLESVNDNAKALCDLSIAMFDAGVLPYYIHLLDPVAGAEHFHVGLDRSRALRREMMRSLPGYLVPKFVKEIPGEQSKVDLLDLPLSD